VVNDLDILREIIRLMRDRGLVLDSPYDFENWIEDHARHSDLFATGFFITEKEI
jgi:hypothetical protein